LILVVTMEGDDMTTTSKTPPDKLQDLQDRVLKFKLMELPGQMRVMHMGTSYLIRDLMEEILRLNKEK